VDFDESRLAHIHLRTKGWIEKLYLESEGERVKRGDPLLDLYSPELVNAQEEYVQAMRSGSTALLRASRDRLIALGIPRDQIRKLARTREIQQTVTLYAPQDGMVATLPVRNGMYVTPRTRIMSLADLSSVWVLAEVFERQVDWVKLKNPADVRLSYLPGQDWEGRVEYIYPSLDPKTRTLRVRLRFDNPGERLKPNMYANVRIYGGPKENAIVIPLEALIRTGREERVILALGEGRFEARKVKAGIESGDWVEITEGLQPGERVVTSGQFLIDSEASLKASITRMSPPGNEPPEAMNGGIKGEGIIAELMPERGMIKLQHEPIAALDWPAMTMDFRLAEGVSLEGLKPGQRVEFELTRQADSYQVSAIRPLAMTFQGRGIIRGLMPEHGMIKLQHEAISELDWPAMTMDFRLAKGLGLEGLAPGDEVEFSLQKQGDSYVVSALRKLN
jgi:Cu(I)/Ag(I) efflux system membrane fusion protein